MDLAASRVNEVYRYRIKSSLTVAFRVSKSNILNLVVCCVLSTSYGISPVHGSV